MQVCVCVVTQVCTDLINRRARNKSSNTCLRPVFLLDTKRKQSKLILFLGGGHWGIRPHHTKHERGRGGDRRPRKISCRPAGGSLVMPMAALPTRGCARSPIGVTWPFFFAPLAQGCWYAQHKTTHALSNSIDLLRATNPKKGKTGGQRTQELEYFQHVGWK